MRPGSTQVLVVDDHPIVRKGLVDLFAGEPGLSVVGEAATAAEALAIAASSAPNVATVDLILEHDDGLQLVTDLAKTRPAMGILVISSHDERLYAARALSAGARGYIMKSEAPDQLLKAVRLVATDRPYVSASAAEAVLAGMGSRRPPLGSPLERLSNRERHVLSLLGRGLAIRDIAERLQISRKTVEAHCAHIKEKLGARDGRELLRLAFSWTDRT